jgi:hypothetical protein
VEAPAAIRLQRSAGSWTRRPARSVELVQGQERQHSRFAALHRKVIVVTDG